MSEFGDKVVGGIDVRYHGDETRFDPISFTDYLIELSEKPEFNKPLVLTKDQIFIVSPVFQTKIVSQAKNYVQDYFELRAQPGRDGSGTDGLSPEIIDYVHKKEYEPIPAEIIFTRIDGLVTQINTTNEYGIKITTFTRLNGVVTEIDIDNYGTTQRNIAFTRIDGKVTQIDITDN